MTARQRRKSIRLHRSAYENPSQIFSVTICTWNRRPIFKDKSLAKVTFESLATGPIGRNTERYACCLMPDHLHLLISPVTGNLVDIISAWKRYGSNRIRRLGLSGKCWQRGFYDHALRTEENLYTAAEYIVNNPVRARIVRNWTDYPFSWHRWMSPQ
jgi:REP element-mobilizing transposase RayT